ncbi:MAG: glutamate--tRNA ligase family protein [Acidobacteria bacterium]|nr:glutamate--tRNA ligase family protein [Acidobacteriota bacterium]
MWLTRFAPAPTGYLHLGHVANALNVWNEARAHGGRVLLRIEDHDRERCRPDYETALLDDLDWLGLVPDLYPTSAFRNASGRVPCESRQSDRGAIYATMTERLRAQGLLYACRCSRRTLQHGGVRGDSPASGLVKGGGGTEVSYPGTCRDLGLPFGGDVGWRVRLPTIPVTFDDRWCGRQRQVPAEQCGDLLIRDRRGNWTYQFVATVDDYIQGVTDVIRGADLLPSTGRQILLGGLLGRLAPATFAHHALIMKSPTRKLSKSDRDTGVRDLRALGWTSEQVLAAAGSTSRA